MQYLIASPPGIPHDVDDRAETTDTSVVSVQSTFDVVVKLGADLDTRSLSYTEHERGASNWKDKYNLPVVYQQQIK